MKSGVNVCFDMGMVMFKTPGPLTHETLAKPLTQMGQAQEE